MSHFTLLKTLCKPSNLVIFGSVKQDTWSQNPCNIEYLHNGVVDTRIDCEYVFQGVQEATMELQYFNKNKCYITLISKMVSRLQSLKQLGRHQLREKSSTAVHVLSLRLLDVYT